VEKMKEKNSILKYEKQWKREMYTVLGCNSNGRTRLDWFRLEMRKLKYKKNKCRKGKYTACKQDENVIHILLLLLLLFYWLLQPTCGF
jgi:hypothetical protein